MKIYFLYILKEFLRGIISAQQSVLSNVGTSCNVTQLKNDSSLQKILSVWHNHTAELPKYGNYSSEQFQCAILAS